MQQFELYRGNKAINLGIMLYSYAKISDTYDYEFISQIFVHLMLNKDQVNLETQFRLLGALTLFQNQ